MTLLLTLGASALTLLVLNSLLAPLKASKSALVDYLTERKLPDLSTNFQDEAGILMQKVQKTIIKLNGLLEEKKDLIGLLSHDLRTPLANIRLLSGAIGREEVPLEELQEISLHIRKSVDEQMMLFQDILESLRQDDLDGMKLNLNETASSVIIASALNDVQRMADEKDITLQVNNHYNGNLNVEAGIFPQVLKNLLSNSIKFSHPGSIVNLDVRKPDGKVYIEVKDNGLGFNPEDAELIFQKFNTKGKKGTHNEPSTGMGLYLSKKIVEGHKGKLSASSRGINKGSTFVVEL